MSLILDELTPIGDAVCAYLGDALEETDERITYVSEVLTGVIETVGDSMRNVLEAAFGAWCEYDEMLEMAYDEDPEEEERFFNGAHYINRPSVRTCKYPTKQSYKPMPNKNYPYRRCDRSR